MDTAEVRKNMKGQGKSLSNPLNNVVVQNRPPTGATANDMNTGIDPRVSFNGGLIASQNQMKMSSEEFWKPSTKDISAHNQKKSNSSKVIPFVSNAGALTQSMERVATAQDRNRYDKERDRDPAVSMAAMNYRKVNSLRNETADTQFSYWCSSVDTILDNSASHPSFRIYFAFLKRFLFVMGILM